jgi:hypothetical protein
MARAKTRNKTVAQKTEESSAESAPNPIWFRPVMFGFMIIGLAWIIVFYLSNQQWPVPPLGNWNILVGFGIMFIGFLMTTRWR